MKKITSVLLLAFSMFAFNNCLLFNMLSLNPGHEKGSVAAGRITDAAIKQDLISYTVILGRPSVSILSIIADDLAGIEPGKYYKTKEVDACISEINSLGWVISGGLAAATCNIQPDNILLDP